jgi:hypothetical protein
MSSIFIGDISLKVCFCIQSGSSYLYPIQGYFLLLVDETRFTWYYLFIASPKVTLLKIVYVYDKKGE